MGRDQPEPISVCNTNDPNLMRTLELAI